MRRTWKYLVSAVGLLLLFAAFLMFQMPSIPAWGTVRITDVMMIVGGLMFVVPIYVDSVARKTADASPNRWVWAVLPPIGMAVACIGLLIPNGIGFFGLFPLADLFYLVACLLMLPIFVYPTFELNRGMIEEEVEEQIEERPGR